MRRTCFGYETSHKRNMAHPRSRQALEVHWINEGRHHIPYNPCVGSLSPSAATKTRKSVKTNRRSERHAARHALRDDAHARLNGWPNHPETVDYLGGCFFPAHSVRAVDAWLCLVDQFETHIGGETGHAGHSESGGDRPRRAAPDWARVGQSGPHNLIPGRHHDRPLDDRMVSFCGCHGVGALRRSSFHLAGFNAALAGGNRTAIWAMAPPSTLSCGVPSSRAATMVMAAQALLISARSMARTLARVRETCLITFAYRRSKCLSHCTTWRRAEGFERYVQGSEVGRAILRRIVTLEPGLCLIQVREEKDVS
jgi:hypothetical protein